MSLQALGGLSPDHLALMDLLNQLRLSEFISSLQSVGVETVTDLSYCLDADLERMGMPMVPRRKLIEAAGGDWRAQKPRGTLEDQLAGRTRGAPARMLKGEGDPDMDDLLLRAKQHRMDFVDVNDLDAAAESALEALAPYSAAYVMGLIGKANTFVMFNVRRPSAAVVSRCRQARQDPYLEGDAYEDLTRLLDSFIEINCISEPGRASLQALNRDELLHVMGFTSGKPYRIKGASDRLPDDEVNDRIRLAVESNGMKEPADMALAQRQHHEELRRRATFSERRGRSRSRSRGRRSRSRERESSRRSGGGGGGGSGGGDRFVWNGTLDDATPSWQGQVECFVEANGLDERSSDALYRLTKLQALRVMGFIGRENTFLLKGARNVNAAVMGRLRYCDNSPTQDEYFMGWQKLIEDFVIANRLDDRVAGEAMRVLSPQQALHVMGCAGSDHTFLIRGGGSKLATLHARINEAKRALP